MCVLLLLLLLLLLLSLSLPAVPSASACSSLGLCLNFISPKCSTAAVHLYRLIFSASSKPTTANDFYRNRQTSAHHHRHFTIYQLAHSPLVWICCGNGNKYIDFELNKGRVHSIAMWWYTIWLRAFPAIYSCSLCAVKRSGRRCLDWLQICMWSRGHYRMVRLLSYSEVAYTVQSCHNIDLHTGTKTVK